MLCIELIKKFVTIDFGRISKLGTTNTRVPRKLVVNIASGIVFLEMVLNTLNAPEKVERLPMNKADKITHEN